MAAKILVGLVAAFLATGVGVYVAFSGSSGNPGPEAQASESLPVSEGACCAQKALQASCCTLSADCSASDSREAVAACTGPVVMVNAGPTSKATAPVICCGE